MKILAISCYYHDASAALLIDGQVVSVAAEERFTRVKHDQSFPKNAIEFCLRSNNFKIEDVDYVAFYEKPLMKFERFFEFTVKGFPKTYLQFISQVPTWLKDRIMVLRKVRKSIKFKKKVFFVNHHMSHAASFFASPFDKAAILVVDGVGEYATTSYGFGQGNNVKIKSQINFPHSIGLLYSAITAYLGFAVNNDEYKVMGLSSYGSMNKDKNEYYSRLKKVISMNDDGSYQLSMDYFSFQYGSRMCSNKMYDLLGGKPRKEIEPIEKKHEDIAAALQMITEESLFVLLNKIHDQFPSENLVFSGGVALNSVVNGKIVRNTPFKNVWILPDPGDGGTCVGAGLFVYNHLMKQPRSPQMKSAYLGPEFSDKEVEEFLVTNKIKHITYSSQEEMVKAVAKIIFDNKVVGWFQGRMEFGPRALGSRSILANPLNPDMQDILNLKVKHREQFRPFAPAVLKEEASKYFEMDKNFQDPCDFMLMVYPIKEEWRKRLPAVTHIDGSGRVQTISRFNNERYYDLIKEFGTLSGVPILVNTSFNVKGEPIVCTPNDAYKCMLGTEIDYLIMGKSLIKRADNLT